VPRVTSTLPPSWATSPSAAERATPSDLSGPRRCGTVLHPIRRPRGNPRVASRRRHPRNRGVLASTRGILVSTRLRESGTRAASTPRPRAAPGTESTWGGMHVVARPCRTRGARATPGKRMPLLYQGVPHELRHAVGFDELIQLSAHTAEGRLVLSGMGAAPDGSSGQEPLVGTGLISSCASAPHARQTCRARRRTTEGPRPTCHEARAQSPSRLCGSS